MQSLLILQEGVDTSLNWLFFTLLGFMAVVVIVGAVVGRGSDGADRSPNSRPKKILSRTRPAAKTQSVPRAKRAGPHRRSN